MKTIKALLATLLNQIRSLSSKLGEAPVLIYFLGYLIVIFVFSLIYYYALPGKHFYHSTAQYEYKFFNNDIKEILHDLRTEIRQLYQENGEAKQEISGWRIDTNNLETDSLNMENFPSEFSFQIIIPINNGTQGNWDSWTFLSAKVIVFTEEWISNDIVYSPFKIENTTTTPVQGIPNRIPSPGIVYPYKVFDQQGAAPVLPLSQNLYNKITGVWQGINGFPPKDSGQYLRMLYLSTGIATLSTLGDIFPVSTEARLSVTLETIIAVIFIGLFLNSLVYDIGEALKSAQPIDKITNRIVSSTNKKRPTKHAPDVWDSAASRKESKPRKNPASKQNPRPPTRR